MVSSIIHVTTSICLPFFLLFLFFYLPLSSPDCVKSIPGHGRVRRFTREPPPAHPQQRGSVGEGERETADWCPQVGDGAILLPLRGTDIHPPFSFFSFLFLFLCVHLLFIMIDSSWRKWVGDETNTKIRQGTKTDSMFWRLRKTNNNLQNLYEGRKISLPTKHHSKVDWIPSHGTGALE